MKLKDFDAEELDTCELIETIAYCLDVLRTNFTWKLNNQIAELEREAGKGETDRGVGKEEGRRRNRLVNSNRQLPQGLLVHIYE
jgi:hypothetical protein